MGGCRVAQTLADDEYAAAAFMSVAEVERRLHDLLTVRLRTLQLR